MSTSLVPPPSQWACPRSILLVDDDADVVRLMARIFGTYAKHAVTEASDGRAALRALYAADTLPCVIVLDLMMAGASGLDVIVELRRHKSFAAIPVVLVTAASDVPALCRTHARSVIRKPFARLELMVTVQELCRAGRDQPLARSSTLPPPPMRQSGTWRATTLPLWSLPRASSKG